MSFPPLPTPRLFVPDAGEPALRWGIIGTGFIAGFLVGAVQRHTSQRIVAVASRRPERAEQFAAEHDIATAAPSVDALLDRDLVDAVYIAAPQAAHHELGLRAIAAGKHVLIEKPLALDPVEARDLVEAARAAGLLLMEAMWSRYQPQSLVIRQLVADGVLGTVHNVLADHGQAIPAGAGHRLRDPAAGGGALLDLGIYPVQLDSMVLGVPDSVTAVGSISAEGVDASATLVLRHGTPDPSVLTTSIETSTPTVASINGSLARIELAGPFHIGSGFTVRAVDWGVEPLVFVDDSDLRYFDALAWQVNAFARYVGEGRLESPLHDHAETIAVLTTLGEARRQLTAASGVA